MRAASAVLTLPALLAAAVFGCSATPNVTEDAGPDDSGTEPLSDGAIGDSDAGPDKRDAAKDGTAPGTGFCRTLVPAPRFCDDFDDGDLDNQWTSTAFVPGSVAELDETSYTSGPASFHVLTKPIVAVGAGGNVLLRYTSIVAVSRAKLSFSVFLPAVTFAKGTIAIAGVDVALDHFFTLYLRDRDTTAPTAILEEYVAGTVTRHILTKLPPVGAWTRVGIDLDLTTGIAGVTFGTEKALDAEPISVLAGTEATVRIGAIMDGPADAFEARFDDVVIDF